MSKRNRKQKNNIHTIKSTPISEEQKLINKIFSLRDTLDNGVALNKSKRLVELTHSQINKIKQDLSLAEDQLNYL